MPYTPPTIGPSGLSIPTYADVLAFLNSHFLTIFGAASYLGPDSADEQDIAIRALMNSQTGQALQGVFLSFNPLTAIGRGLDLCGTIIGTPRKAASFSTALLTVSGTAGTVITNGVVRDTNNNLWNLPAVVTIGGGGTVSTLATAQIIGAITANAATVIIIATPTQGWSAVTNPGAAIPGQAVESDSQYRARLLVAQAKPSLTLRAGTAAAVAAVPGVTRSVVYENPYGYTASYGLVNTSGTAVTLLVGYPFDSSMATQAITIAGVPYTVSSVGGAGALTLGSSAGTQNGVAFYVGSPVALGPAHSITTVTEGGVPADIAQAIYDNRGIGPLTNGTTSVNVTDPLNPAITIPISFDLLTYVPIYVALNVHPLSGYTSAAAAAIKTAVAAYLNNLGIGQTVVFSELYGAALIASPNASVPLFSIRAIASAAEAAETTANLNTTTTIVVTSATGIANGQTVIGAGIPDNTTVSSIAGAPNIVISNAATATATGVPVHFFPPGGTVDIPVNYQMAAQGSVTEVVVNLV